MNKKSICIAILLTLGAATQMCQSAHAADPKPGAANKPTMSTVPTLREVGTITGVTISPANPVVGEAVSYVVTMSGAGYCTVDWKASSDVKAAAGSAFANARPATGVTIPNNIVMQADTYTVKIEGSKHIANNTYPACRGEATLTYVVAKPAITGLIVPDVIHPDKPYKILLSGHGQCSYHVDYGDGQFADKTETLPVDLNHFYLINSTETKLFKLKVNGIAGQCNGAANADVTVAGPGEIKQSGNPNPAVGAAATTKPPLKITCPPGKAC